MNHHNTTHAIHAGRTPDISSGAVMQPIVLSTTFEREPDGSYRSGFVYSRGNNPNRQSLEECLVALERSAATVEAVSFASGLAASMSILHALSPQAHVVFPVDLYFGTGIMVRELYERWSVDISWVDMTDAQAVQDALRPDTKLLWLETPSNPTLKVIDIAQMAALAHSVGAVCVSDNTWSPLIQQPFEHGADIVVYSTTKYFGGHSDILSGAVLVRSDNALLPYIRSFQTHGGAVPSPFDCWLLLRSISTLPYRLQAHCNNAQRVAEFLAQHPQIQKVHYPGLADNPYHHLASKQMSAFGGMVSFEVRPRTAQSDGREEAFALAARLRLITRATSLGGVESLIEHRASVEGEHTRAPQNLLRLSVGLEHHEDIIADLTQALEYIA
jgi:cystathionine gamma-synthase